MPCDARLRVRCAVVPLTSPSCSRGKEKPYDHQQNVAIVGRKEMDCRKEDPNMMWFCLSRFLAEVTSPRVQQPIPQRPFNLAEFRVADLFEETLEIVVVCVERCRGVG